MSHDGRADHMAAAMEKLSKTQVHRDVIGFYLGQMAGKPASTVLDLGAGAGKVTLELAGLPSVTRVIAYDRSVDAMRAMPQHPKIEKRTDGSHLGLPFPAATSTSLALTAARHSCSRRPTRRPGSTCAAAGGTSWGASCGTVAGPTSSSSWATPSPTSRRPR
jgi:hypothetical protein